MPGGSKITFWIEGKNGLWNRGKSLVPPDGGRAIQGWDQFECGG